MLSNEILRQPLFLHQQYTSETDQMDSYSTESFDFNNAAFDTFPHSVDEHSITYSGMSVDDKYEMTRTASNGTSRSTYDMPPTLLSHSVGSAASSTVGSPYSNHAQMVPSYHGYSMAHPFSSGPTIVYDDGNHFEPTNCQNSIEWSYSESDHKPEIPFVDPGLISGTTDTYYTHQYNHSPSFSYPSQAVNSHSAAPSPVPSHGSYQPTFSLPVTLDSYNNQNRSQRQGSESSQRSGNSPRPSLSGDEDNGEKGRGHCQECGKVFKDLKAHLLTHQSTRPEKCPIVSCDYYTKGFARKYDKNRHTLTHYKGTMICGFCPGSGSPLEKSFNRADVFKRHLTSVHGVEQTAPNSRRKSPAGASKKLSSYCPDATGKCSTCTSTFSNAQDFYEHLDDCVLRVVSRVEPCEAFNLANLAKVESDPAVHETLERHHIKTEQEYNPLDEAEEEDDDEDMDNDEEDENETYHDRASRNISKASKASGVRVVVGGNIAKNTKSSRKGMTWSKGGVALLSRGRKRRSHYPPSWGLAADKLKMKKRVILSFDGPHRLLKDDIMLHSENEVRMSLPSGTNYVTDLDIQTIKRADAFHNATAEEKGLPEEQGEWMQQQDFLDDLMR